MKASPGVLYSIYRARNEATVARLCDSAAAQAMTVHLWALDQATEALTPWTRGVGPGQKFDVLNRLHAEADPEPAAWLVISDDDVVLSRRGLRRLVEVSEAAGLDLTQPAHRRGSHLSHAITKARCVRARWTSFVEIGPVVAISPKVRNEVLPFPSDAGMGWGLDFTWHDLSARGYRLGIIDSVRMRHLGKIGEAYDSTEARRVVRRELDARGLHDVPDIHRTLGVWSWQMRVPPWLSRP